VGNHDAYCVPGPLQIVRPPSPLVQLTDTGWATAVAETGPAVAVTDSSCQMPGSTQYQVARSTTELPDGSRRRAGLGRVIEFSASNASTLGSTGGVVDGWEPVTHTVRVTWTAVATSTQVTEYHAPGSGPPGANPP
jgi:hypothetical protein